MKPSRWKPAVAAAAFTLVGGTVLGLQLSAARAVDLVPGPGLSVEPTPSLPGCFSSPGGPKSDHNPGDPAECR